MFDPSITNSSRLLRLQLFTSCTESGVCFFFGFAYLFTVITRPIIKDLPKRSRRLHIDGRYGERDEGKGMFECVGHIRVSVISRRHKESCFLVAVPQPSTFTLQFLTLSWLFATVEALRCFVLEFRIKWSEGGGMKACRGRGRDIDFLMYM